MNEYLNTLSQDIIDGFMDPARIPFALAASLLVVIGGIIGGGLIPRAVPFYWIVMDGLFGRIGERLDRKHRAPADLMFRGMVFTGLILFITLALAKALTYTVSLSPLYGVSELLFLSLLLSAGSVWHMLWRLYKALERGGQAKGAFYALSRSAHRNLSSGDDMGMTRIAMSYAARSFDKHLVAPVFWYLLLGLPAVMLYSAVSMLAWRYGKDGFTKGFGRIPLALERLMGFVPAYMSSFLITMAGAFTPSAALHRGIGAWLGDRGRAPYEQGGMPLSAMAWSLKVSLGGASQDLSGGAVKGEWVGPEGASAQNDHRHLRRSLLVSVNAYVLFLAVLCGNYLWAGNSTLFERLSDLFSGLL